MRLPIVIASVACCLFAQQYSERFRPQFHFSPKSNWTNDPCGLVYAFGQYHLFFQHNPFAEVWGHMSWGHAVSPDLVHWTQLPVAIPDDPQVAIFTGSSVVDEHNTSGLCAPSPKGCIVSVYTGYTPKSGSSLERQTQNLAFSQDGKTWTKYARNPVLDLGKSDTRDPQVFWNEPTHRWIMAIVQADSHKVLFFASRNLIRWEHLSDFGPQAATGGQWECPDLVRLPVRNKPGVQHWLLKIGLNPGHIAGGSGEQYFTGEFDGTSFRSDNPSAPVEWADYGRDSYCTLTFNNQPGDTKAMGWMNNWQYAGTAPTTPWRGAMTIPRTLSLTETDRGLRLVQTPLAELRALRGESFEYEGSSEAELNRRLAAWPYLSQTFEIEAAISPGRTTGEVKMEIFEGATEQTTIGYNVPTGVLYADRTKSAGANFSKSFPSKTEAPLRIGSDPLKLHIFADTSSVEIFAQDGRVAMTNLVFPNPRSAGIRVASSGGPMQRIQFRMWKMKSVWSQKAQ